MSKTITLNSRDGYNKVAKQYQKMHSYLDEFEQNKLLPLLGDIKNKKVLDIGAGTGRLTNRLLKLGCELTVLDISSEMLNILQKKIKEPITVKVGTAEDLPFADDSFDIIIATFLIVHLKDLSKFFSEVYRVLKSGGKFLVTNVNQKEPVALETAGGFVQVESYYHRPEEVIEKLENLAFKIEQNIFIKEKDVWINEIIVVEK